MNANFERIAQDLVQQLSTRFPGMRKASLDNKPIDGKELRDGDVRKISFDFTNRRNGEKLTNVSINLSDADEKPAMSILWNKNPKDESWVNFLDELGDFAQSHSLDFDLQNPTQTNLDKRDPIGEGTMTESKLSGTSRTSFQDIGEARVLVRHNAPINFNAPNGRTQHIERIFIENAVGERFAYPVKHLNGARALARHVSEGGTPYDEIGEHIIGLSEEMAKLRVFKHYVDRNEMISEAMGAIHSKVIERIEQVKKEIHSLQSARHYSAFKESFTARAPKEVPEDILNDWVDRLTVRTFNEELKSVFPYIYSLVDESDIPVKEIDANDLLGEEKEEDYCDACDRPADDCVCDDTKTESLEDQFESAIEQIVREDDDLFRDDERGEKAMQKLKDIFAQEVPIGTNGNNATSSIRGIIDKSKLERAFELLADLGLDEMDARPIISNFLKAQDEENDTEYAAQLGFDTEGAPAPEEAPVEPPAEAPAAEAPPAEPAPAEAPAEPAAAPAEPAPAEAPVAENTDEAVDPFGNEPAPAKPGFLDRMKSLAGVKSAVANTTLGDVGSAMAKYNPVALAQKGIQGAAQGITDINKAAYGAVGDAAKAVGQKVAGAVAPAKPMAPVKPMNAFGGPAQAPEAEFGDLPPQAQFGDLPPQSTAGAGRGSINPPMAGQKVATPVPAKPVPAKPATAVSGAKIIGAEKAFAEQQAEMVRRKQSSQGIADKLFGDIEERVSGFFNSNEGTMTIGEEGFVTKMCKELKEKYNIQPDTMRSEKFDQMVERACNQIMEKYKGHAAAQQQQDRMLELAGTNMSNHNATEAIRARVAQRKAQPVAEHTELSTVLKFAGLK